MRIAVLTASTAAMFLTSTTLLAQQAAATLENVYLDVDGAAVQVPVALAAEACNLEEAIVLQTAAARLEESGLNPALMQAADAEPGVLPASDPEATDHTGVQGTGAAATDAGAPGHAAATPEETSNEADLATSEEDAEPSSAEAAVDEGTVAVPDASNQTVTTAQGTADPSTAAPGDEMLALAVCQIDVVRAADLGIPQANEIVTD